jgi:hypothetical protein
MRWALCAFVVLAACSHSHNGGTNGDGGSGSGDGGGVVDSACPAYQHYCNGACIPTSVDPDNCGGCGVKCTSSQVCSGGACESSCLPGLTPCNRECVDTKTDSNNCNACGNVCSSGTGCSNGNCVTSQGGTTLPMCVNGGPVINLGNGTSAGCTAQTTFQWALCSCMDVSLSSTLITDAYDSSMGPYIPPGAPGAGVGINRSYIGSSPATISGALWASDSGGMNPSQDVHVGEELHVGGPLGSSKPITCGKDAFVVGDAQTSSMITIAQTLHQPTGASVSGGVTFASRVFDNPTVPPPCDCKAADLLPITTLITAHKTDNENAMIGLLPDALANPPADARLDLPCGRYYLTSIGGSHSVTIVAHGNTALFVDGSVALSGSLYIEVDPTGQLDVLIAGTLQDSMMTIIGSPNYPALSRFYIGSTSGFQISQSARLGAFFYAPYGLVSTSAPLTEYGGIFAGDFQASQAVDIHYDQAVLEVGGNCGTTGCTSCKDCGNQACVNGTCGACTDSSQCCAPLACVSGVCQDVIP